jgi:hypothetical protein
LEARDPSASPIRLRIARLGRDAQVQVFVADREARCRSAILIFATSSSVGSVKMMSGITKGFDHRCSPLAPGWGFEQLSASAISRLDMQLKGGAVFTQIGWPQFLIIVVILVIGLLYSQRHRF